MFNVLLHFFLLSLWLSTLSLFFHPALLILHFLYTSSCASSSCHNLCLFWSIPSYVALLIMNTTLPNLQTRGLNCPSWNHLIHFLSLFSLILCLGRHSVSIATDPFKFSWYDFLIFQTFLDHSSTTYAEDCWIQQPIRYLPKML